MLQALSQIGCHKHPFFPSGKTEAKQIWFLPKRMQLVRAGSSSWVCGTLLSEDCLCEGSMPGFVSPESPQMELRHRPLPTSWLRETAGRVKYIRAASGTCCAEKIEPKTPVFGRRQEAVLQRYITFIFVCTFFLIRKLGFGRLGGSVG